MTHRIVVGITGASGSVYGIRALELLAEVADVETHLVMTPAAKITLAAETKLSTDQVEERADVVHSNRDIAAAIASGSFRTEGMIVAPCSMDMLAKLATGRTDDVVSLVLSAIDVRSTPVLLAPSMNASMWAQASTRRNVETLTADGFRMIGPDEGWQACRTKGAGRMSEPEAIMGALADTMLEVGGHVTGIIPNALHGKEIAHTGLTELHVVDSMHERKSLMPKARPHLSASVRRSPRCHTM